MLINALNIIEELLAKRTLLFTLASRTVLYQFGPPLLCGTILPGMVLRVFTLASEPVQTGTKQ